MKFKLTKYELKESKKWIKKHSKDHVIQDTAAIGGRWSYIFTPTSIGDFVSIKCNACNESKQISDLSSF